MVEQFYENLLEYYDDLFPLDRERIACIQKEVPIRHPDGSPAYILDVGCASGTTALALLKAGYLVTGIDLNRAMIQSANRRNPEPKTNGHFFIMDMLEIDRYLPHQHFDGILCLGNTLVHLRDSGQILEFFTKVLQLLRPQTGIFLFQVLNYDRILDRKEYKLPELASSRCRFVRTYTPLSDGRLEFRGELFASTGNKVFSEQTVLYPARPALLDDLLRKAGFTEVTFYSSYARAPFDSSSLVLVGVARER